MRIFLCIRLIYLELLIAICDAVNALSLDTRLRFRICGLA